MSNARSKCIKLTFQEASRSSTTPLSCRLAKVLAFHEHKFFFRNTCTLVWWLFWSETLGVFFATLRLENHLFLFRFKVKLSHHNVDTKWPFPKKHGPVIGQYCLLIGCCLVTFTPYMAFKFFKSWLGSDWARSDKTFVVSPCVFCDIILIVPSTPRTIDFM